MAKLQWFLTRLIERIGLAGWVAWILLVLVTVYGFYVLLPAQQSLLLLEQRPVVETKPNQIIYSYDSPSKQFFDQTPSVEKVTSSIQSVFDVAQKYRLAINEVTYKDEQKQGEKVVHYNMSFSVMASYPEIKAFIVDVLATLPYTALEQLAFERDNIHSDIVSANLRFTFYMVRS